MSAQASNRLMRDFQKILKENTDEMTASPEENNIFKWNAVIIGPKDTIWEDGIFNLTLEFTEEYPNKSPKVSFVTKMFHPNIYPHGGICLDILGNQWVPIYDVHAILTSIRSLLSDPNPHSPANPEAAALYNENRQQYNRRVKDIVQNTWN